MTIAPYVHAFVDCTSGAVQGSATWRREADHTNDNGPSLVAEWVATPGRVEIRQDRLAMLPIFWWAALDRFVASTSLLEVARRSGARDLDWGAIAAFMAVGNYCGVSTPFVGVRTLTPGARLTWQSGAAPVVHSPPLPDIAPFTGTMEEAKTIYADLFKKAVARRLPADMSKVVVPLSGGRDSRHVALEIASQGKTPINFITIRSEFGPTDEDVRVAAVLAERLASPHTVIEIDWDNYVEMERLKNFNTHYAVHVDHHSMFEMSMSPGLHDAVVFFGTGGDVLIGDAYFTAKTEALLKQGRFEEVAEIELAGHQSPPWLRGGEKLSRANAKQHLVEFLKTVPRSTNMFRDYVLLGRQVRNTALVPFDLILRRNRVATPFLDVELLDFQRSLPADPFGPSGPHDAIIAESYPQFADIPYERKGLKEAPTADRRRKAIVSAWRNLDFGERVFRDNVVQTFIWPRFARACLTRGIDDMWWLRKLLYMLDLLAFSRDPKASYQAAAQRHELFYARQSSAALPGSTTAVKVCP